MKSQGEGGGVVVVRAVGGSIYFYIPSPQIASDRGILDGCHVSLKEFSVMVRP